MPSFTPLRPEDPTHLGGHELRGRLGEGGQGVVYLGDGEHGRFVAIKWLRPHLAGDRVAAERFVREASLAQRVAPFCTARCLATGVQDGRPYIVSEFVDGSTLHQVVAEEGPRSGVALHRLAIGTVTALAAIHQAGIVHRDFSPANVLLAAEGPRVIDFGIARALDMTSITSAPVGTPWYVSPEQITGHPVSPAADLFAWGATMVYAARGRPPFGGESVPAVIHQVLQAPPDLAGLDGPLRDLVAACLSKDPSRRPTAEQAIMALVGQPVPLHEAASAATPDHPPPPGSPLTHPQSAAHPSPGTAPQSDPGLHGGRPFVPAQQAWHHPGGPVPPPPTWSGHPQPGLPQSGPIRPGSFGSGSPHPGPPHPSSPHPSPAPPYQRVGGRRGPVVAGAAAALAVVVTLVTVIVVMTAKDPVTRQTASPGPGQTAEGQTAGQTPGQTAGQSPGATQPAQPVATAGLSQVKLPGTGVTLFEHPSDPSILTAYTVVDPATKSPTFYPRQSLTGAFAPKTGYWQTLLSPDGKHEVARPKRYTDSGRDSVELTDKATGATRVVETVKYPLLAYVEQWSRDSTRVLLNVGKEAGEGYQSTGFAIVEVSTGRVNVVTLRESSLRDVAFGFDDQDRGVVVMGRSPQQALRFFDTSGRRVRRVPNVGSAPAGLLFSPSGRQFQTTCPGLLNGDHCVYDTASGQETRRFESACTGDSWWFDEAHLSCWMQDDDGSSQIVVIGFTGAKVRVLAEVPKADAGSAFYYTLR
ncbi:serine/threonine-protein kinase [Nonomuraea sp. NPDC050310]|uniref:serine/threonine protein kinase n=1 Tax=Nonomuraea sp. NPDC050310 TaxID=3154935 RepID=UPI0034015949